MDDLPVFVPDMSFDSTHHDSGPGGQFGPLTIIRIKGSRYDPQGALREAATRKLIQFLLRADQEYHGDRGICAIRFEGVYLEPASVLALEQYMRRNATINVGFDGGCHGAGFELALCMVFSKSNCPTVVIDRRQRLNFTPTLADALGNSRSLRYLSIESYALDESNMNEIKMNASQMKLLALSLCHNQHLHTLVLDQAFQGDESIVAFASCMHGMTSLRRMQLMGNEFGTLGEQALFQVLEEAKTSVDQLLLEGKPDHVGAHIDFLLRLKQKGGQSYIGTCDPNQWIELLDEFKDDTNALYYILCADAGHMSK
jgi:hypothetical protein